MDKTPEELAEEYLKNNHEYFSAKEAFLAAYKAGYQAAAPQWISVKDRLPELDVQCFWVDAKLIALSALAAISIDDCIVWWENYTHWMPLPKMPTKEES